MRIIIRTAAGHLRKATSVGSGRKDLAREQVEMIASSVCGIIQKLVLHATSFVESEEEWMTHREDEPIDSESDDILDALCSLMGEYLHDAGKLNSCAVTEMQPSDAIGPSLFVFFRQLRPLPMSTFFAWLSACPPQLPRSPVSLGFDY